MLIDRAECTNAVAGLFVDDTPRPDHTRLAPTSKLVASARPGTVIRMLSTNLIVLTALTGAAARHRLVTVTIYRH